MAGEVRAAVEFTATIASGTAYSSAFPYPMSNFANGFICASGANIPFTGHLTLQIQDFWYNWVNIGQYDSGYSDVTLQFPTGGVAHMMPPTWFGAVGSARLATTNGTASGVLPTAACTYSFGLKS